MMKRDDGKSEMGARGKEQSPASGPVRSGESISRETLLAVQTGDPGALGELFEFAFDRVFSLASRLIGNPVTAQDVVQDVFLKVHRSIGSIDPDRDPRPWLTTITYNACRDHWRSQKAGVAGRSISLDENPAVAESLRDGGVDPGEALEQKEQASHVQDALNQLPEDLRAVVLLRDYDGRKHEEIAEIVGVSGQAVRKRYSRALTRLGEILKEMER